MVVFQIHLQTSNSNYYVKYLINNQEESGYYERIKPNGRL